MAASFPTAYIPLRQPLFRQNRSSSSCTHRKVTRIYDQHNCQRCTLCHRIPDFGFLYRCTQESDGHLPMSDFIDEDIAMDLADLQVNHGAYDPNTAPHASSSRSSFATIGTLSTNSMISSEGAFDSEMATDENLAQAYDGKRKFEVAFPPDQAYTVPRCDLRVCHACRPIYRERAWQSLDQIVTTTPDAPSQIELDNRRVSDATTILRIRNPSNDPSELSNIHSDQDTISHIVSFHDSGEHDSASDADDEKGFAREEEDSDASALDAGGISPSPSESEDLVPPSEHFRSLRCSALTERSTTPSDLERTQPSHYRRISNQQRDRNGFSTPNYQGMSREEMKRKRLTEGRFVID